MGGIDSISAWVVGVRVELLVCRCAVNAILDGSFYEIVTGSIWALWIS